MEKIIVFTPSLNIGGIERILLTYAKGLAQKSYEIIYLTLSNQGDFEVKSFDNLTFENLGVSRLRQSLFALVNFFRTNKPDIILCANDATMMVYAAKILSGSSIKIITSQHNYYANYLDMGFKKTFVPKYIYPRCHKVIAVSEGIRTMLINDFNLKTNQVVTISNPIDVLQIQQQSTETISNVAKDYILFVGRFDKIKNIPLLIDAFKIFNKKFPEVKLVLIGGGEELNLIKDYIIEKELKQEIQILGVKSNPFPYIKNAKIVVLSSISEAFPTILLESLVLGVTIVSTPTPGGIDILQNGSYGYISDNLFDVHHYSEKLIQAYLKPMDSSKLVDYATLNYNLDLKIVELERLWSKC